MSNSVTFTDACKAGRIDALNKMIEDDISLVNAKAEDQIPAIIHATCANQIEVVDFLLSHGADIEAKDMEFKATALGFAAWFGRAEVAKFLVERGADVDGMGEDPSPLALALDGADGKLTEEGSPGTTEDHAAIVALLKNHNAQIIGRIAK